MTGASQTGIVVDPATCHTMSGNIGTLKINVFCSQVFLSNKVKSKM